MIKTSEFSSAAEKLRRAGGPEEVVELLEQAAHEPGPEAARHVAVPDHEESATRGHLAAALAKAQGAMTAALKDRENKHLRTMYADLASVMDVGREPLSVNGLAITQRPSATGTSVTIITELLHASGEWMRDRLTMPIEQIVSREGGKQLWAHALGSAITYGRRYAYSAMLGIASEEDDDGNGVSSQRDEQDRPSRESALEKAKAKLAARGEPMAVFGAAKLKGKKLSELAVEELSKLLKFGREAVNNTPHAAWALEWAANCTQIEAEVERRASATPAPADEPS